MNVRRIVGLTLACFVVLLSISNGFGILAGKEPDISKMSPKEGLRTLGEWILSQNAKEEPGVMVLKEPEGYVVDGSWKPADYGGDKGMLPVYRVAKDFLLRLHKTKHKVAQVHLLASFDTESVKDWTGLNLSLGAYHVKKMPSNAGQDPVSFILWLKSISDCPVLDAPSIHKTWADGGLVP